MNLCCDRTPFFGVTRKPTVRRMRNRGENDDVLFVNFLVPEISPFIAFFLPTLNPPMQEQDKHRSAVIGLGASNTLT